MAKARPNERNPICEESNISLELSLSLGSTSMVATATDERYFQVGDRCQRKEYKMENFEEKKNESVSSEVYRNQYQREEFYLNMPSNPEVGDDANCTSNKRERMENHRRSRRNKRIKAEKQERCNEVDTELRLGPDPWCIKKRLTESDLGDMSRLMLAKKLVESHIFPAWNADQLARIKEGLPVSMWDCDTQTEYDMSFKRWNKGANVLIKNWKRDFVDRRQLKAGDEIGLFWDNFSSRFKFSVLNQAASH